MQQNKKDFKRISVFLTMIFGNWQIFLKNARGTERFYSEHKFFLTFIINLTELKTKQK
jgi:hypothetical protein